MLFNTVEIAKTTINTPDEVHSINYAESCLLNLQQTNLDWYNLTKKTIKLESKALTEENSTLLTLSIDNYFNKVIEILNNMRIHLMKFWNQFKIYVKHFNHRNAKFFKKYEAIFLKKDLKRFNAYSRKYTLTNKVPNLSVKDDFLRDFTIDNLNNLSNNDIIKLEGELENFGDRFRGKVLNQHNSILKEDFVTKLELCYRGNSADEVKLDFSSGSVKSEFLNYIRSFDKDVEELDNTKQQINSFYDKLINYFKSFSSIVEQQGSDIVKVRTIQGSYANISNANYDLLTTYGDLKSRMCKTALSIYNLAFSMKLDAYKERNNKFKEILVDALNFNRDKDEEEYTVEIFKD